VKVFFNQIQLHHHLCLDAELRRSIESILDEKDWPRNVYYGDGSPIEDAVIHEVTALYERNMVALSWRLGDVILVDNMLTAHARSPYAGRRKVFVAMGEMLSDRDVAQARPGSEA
jgi:hypothetical protein